ncbi:MAG: hypothetical protein MUF06_21275 [Pirellulaceae bacterium]|nr:hypothetical protein [Pirellulaceae bacterium]
MAWKRKSPIKREDGTKTQSGNPVFRTTYSLSRSTGCRAECDSGSKETADSVAAISAKCQLSIAAFNLLNIIEDHFIQETTENLEEQKAVEAEDYELAAELNKQRQREE